jgi:S1-C subfamily serine protease
MVGVHVEVPRDRPSAATLGTERWGSGIIVDEAGHVLTVSYILLDAGRIEVTLQEGRKVPGRLAGLDLESGLGLLSLPGPGPWPAATIGDSTVVKVGDLVGSVGVREGGGVSALPGRVEAIRPFSAAWEYMLDRALIVAPFNPAFGGGAVVDAMGALVAITSLRLGAPPHVNLAIPVEKFTAARGELIARGRVESRPPRPWLGLFTESREGGGVVVVGVSPVGPAGAAGIRQDDVIVRIGGEPVSTREAFYGRLWEGRVGEPVELTVERGGEVRSVTVRPADRYRVYRTTEK